MIDSSGKKTNLNEIKRKKHMTALQQLQKFMPNLRVSVTPDPKAPARKLRAEAEQRKALNKAAKLQAARISASQVGINITDPRVIQMRTIKEQFMLRSVDIVDLMAEQGYEITRSQLQAYLQGNVLGTDVRNWSSIGRVIELNHIDDLLAQFKKMETKLSAQCQQFANRDMRSIMESWFSDTDISGGCRDRKFAKLIDEVHFTTLFKWFQTNNFPKSMVFLLKIQNRVDAYKLFASLSK
jgi:hypothetical protein